MVSLLPGLIAALAVTQALAYPATHSKPSVSIKNGTVVGSSDGLIEKFLAIPYAQPPVGKLRLKPPRSINKTYGRRVLPDIAPACPQQRQAQYNTTGLPNVTTEILTRVATPYTGPMSEDCLTIDIERPAGVSPHAKLPVLFWIYGGGFENGQTNEYDGYALVNKSIEAGSPMIYVAVNYRVSSFGFMGGKELQKDGSTNLGLRDQRLGLQWVAENIAAFGGDPDKVTIWGESAGAIFVFSHLSLNEGDNTYHGRPLFRGAMMDSGSQFGALPVDSKRPQAAYDKMVADTGCSNAKDSLACLRSVPYEKFLAAQNSQPSYFAYGGNYDLPFMLRPDPKTDFYPIDGQEIVERGKFAQVPVISGNQEDEGTLFAIAARNLTTSDDLVNYYTQYFHQASRETLADWVHSYPEDPAAGSPFETGTQNQLYPQYKRFAAMTGDHTFIWPRRHFLERISKEVPTWSFLATYDHAIPYLGTFHISDTLTVFTTKPQNPEAQSRINQYVVNFVNVLDPNGANYKQTWPRYRHDKLMVNISTSGFSTITDNFRQTSYETWKKHLNELRL